MTMMATQSINTLSEQAQVVLKHRYLLKNNKGEYKEKPYDMFRRVAKAIAKVEKNYYTLPVEAELIENDFYSIMANLEFVPNSPTLMNAGTEQGTLSACFVLPLEDSMEGIMKACHDAAMVQKFGGGTGFSLSNIRPRGSKIQTTHGIACGPIEVLKTLSRVSSMITQGGKRDGANMAIMSVYHPDILDFITCKSVEGDIHNFNISVGVDSEWMKHVKNDMDYELINPHDNTIVGKLNAREVFLKIVQGAWRNGEPGMVFLNRINEDKKFYYQIGHDKAMAGHERGETSDNYGPMATHYNAGYDAGMKKRKSTKPNVVGKDSYGRDIVKVEGHKTKKKYLKDLRMTMNQATLGDMSTALQKGGFQGKGQYEEVELTEGLPKFGEAKQGYSFIATKTHDDKNHTKHDVHMVHTMLGLGHSLADREKSTTRERIGHIVKDKKTGQHIATATHKDFKTGKRLNNKMKPVDRHHDARAALQQSYFRGSFFEEVEYIVEKNVPNNPKLWSRAKSLAKQKFDVYPSAYANGWAARWYKSKGGTWRKGK